MNYEQAIKVWGANRLSDKRHTVNPDTVTVTTKFNEGYACCGGKVEGCYCSYAESPSAYVIVQSGKRSFEINIEDFDFAEILGEIVEAAGGQIT